VVAVSLRFDETTFLVSGGVITAAFSMMAPLLTWGTSRYMMLCILAFMCAGKLSRRYPVLFWMWIAFCLAVYWEVELCNYLTQGDPRVCACQGRLETFLPY
jgi:hypothetical protein